MPGKSVRETIRSQCFLLLCLLGILAYGGSYAWYMLSSLELPHLLRRMTDDAFYYFQIARYLAEGNFSTFDGGITRTNGYHPVWLLLITPIYWILDTEAALFGIKAFEIMLVAGAVIMVVLAARKAKLHWLLLFAVLPTLYGYPHLLEGMESAAAVFMLGALFLALGSFAQIPERRTWPLAVVAFMLPWVRLEYAAISLAATMTLCVIEWSWRDMPRDNSATPPPRSEVLARISHHGVELGTYSTRARLRSFASLPAVVPLLAAVAGCLSYFVYNGLVFGCIVPVSGATKVALSQILSRQWFDNGGGLSIAQNFQVILQLPAFDHELLVVVEVCIYVLLVWWFRRPGEGGRDDWLLLIFLVGMFSIAIGHFAMFVHRGFTMHPAFVAHSAWTYVPAYLMMALIVPVRCYLVVYFIRRYMANKHLAARDYAIWTFLSASAIFIFINTNFTKPYSTLELTKNNRRISWHQSAYIGTRIMNRILPEASIIGSWDSGVIGYFSKFPIVNLDGLVNSCDYLDKRRDIIHEIQRSKDYPESFLHHSTFLSQMFGLTHFANVTSARGTELDNVLFDIMPFNSPPNTRYSFRLWSAAPPRMPSDAFKYFWEQIEPQFDYATDDAGVVVERWSAYAVARDCQRAQDAYPVFFLLHDHDRSISGILNPWTKRLEGRPPSCTDATMLYDGRDVVRVVSVLNHDDLSRHVLEGSPPVLRSHYDVFLNGKQIVYVKEQCDQDDTVDPFFIHVTPVDVSNLPPGHKPNGFHNLGADFARSGHTLGSVCILFQDLPDYDIASIKTGQFVPGGHRRWEGVIRLDVDAERIAGD